jgi:hypothetical protein
MQYNTEEIQLDPENIPYYEGDELARRIYRKDRNKQQLNEEGDLVNSSDEEFIQL